jgi:antitoxin ParD1/3/4
MSFGVEKLAAALIQRAPGKGTSDGLVKHALASLEQTGDGDTQSVLSVDNCCQTAQHPTMSRQTMSFALPESMREYIANRVAAGNYGNTSEYIRDLVRRDQEEQAKKRLRDLIEEGLASGPGRRRTEADEKELLAIARGEID